MADAYDEQAVMIEANTLRKLADQIAPTDNFEDAGDTTLGVFFYGGARGAFAFAATLRGMAAGLEE